MTGRAPRLKPTTVVLGLLCVMYLITYVDRVNIATAASAIQHELGLSNTQLGLVLSAFAYPYLLFQVFGGWVGDRFGPRTHAVRVRRDLGGRDDPHGIVGRSHDAVPRARAARRRRRRDVPGGDARDAKLDAAGRRGFAQGITHAFARLGNAVTPPIVAWLIALVTWRGSFVVLGCCSLVWVACWVGVFPRSPGRASADHVEELESLPNRGAPLAAARPRGAVGAADAADAAGDDRVFLLRLDAVAVPELAAVVLPARIPAGHRKSALFASAVFFAGVVGDMLGGSDQRRASCDADRRPAQGAAQRGGRSGSLGSFVCLLPMFLTHDLMLIVLCLGARVLLRRDRDRPDVGDPDGHRRRVFGNRGGLMNTGSALAAILSPLAFGYIIDLHRQLAAAVRRIARVCCSPAPASRSRCIPRGRSSRSGHRPAIAACASRETPSRPSRKSSLV